VPKGEQAYKVGWLFLPCHCRPIIMSHRGICFLCSAERVSGYAVVREYNANKCHDCSPLNHVQLRRFIVRTFLCTMSDAVTQIFHNCYRGFSLRWCTVCFLPEPHGPCTRSSYAMMLSTSTLEVQRNALYKSTVYLLTYLQPDTC